MFAFFNRLLKTSKTRTINTACSQRKANVAVETLDERLVPATIPNLNHAQFTLNIQGHVAKLTVLNEAVATGKFVGRFEDATNGVDTPVTGIVGAQAAKSTTAAFSFIGHGGPGNSGVEFTGELHGTGTKGATHGSDQLAGSIVEFLFDPNNATSAPTSSMKLTGNDFVPMVNLTNAHFDLPINGHHAQLVILKQDPFNSSTVQIVAEFTDATTGITETVVGSLGRTSKMHNGNPIEKLSFTSTGLNGVEFFGTVRGPGTAGMLYGKDEILGSLTETNAATGERVSGAVYGNDLAPVFDLNQATFQLGHYKAGAWQNDGRLTITSQTSYTNRATFTGTFYDEHLQQTIQVTGTISKASGTAGNGEPVATLLFGGQVTVDATVHTITFNGMVRGPRALGARLGNDFLIGTEIDQSSIDSIARVLQGRDTVQA